MFAVEGRLAALIFALAMAFTAVHGNQQVAAEARTHFIDVCGDALYLNGSPVSQEALAAGLAQGGPDARVNLIVDPAVNHGIVVAILELLQKNAIRDVALATETDFFQVSRVVTNDTEAAVRHLNLEYPDGRTVTYAVEQSPAVSVAHVAEASLEEMPHGMVVSLVLTDAGAAALAEMTSRAGESGQVAILLFGRLHSAPCVRQPIKSGRLQISGMDSEIVAALVQRLQNAQPQDP